MHPNRRPSGQAPFNQDPFGSPFGAFDPMAQMQQMMQQQQQMMSQMMNQHQQFVQSAFGNMAPMHASMHSAMHNPMFSAVHHQPMLSSLQHQQTAPPQRSSVRVEQVDDDTPVGIVHEPIEGPASASRPLQQRHDPYAFRLFDACSSPFLTTKSVPFPLCRVSTNVPFSGMMSGAPMMTSFSSSFMSSSTSNGSQPVVYRSSTSSRSINGVTEVHPFNQNEFRFSVGFNALFGEYCRYNVPSLIHAPAKLCMPQVASWPTVVRW
jgi:hypothetical protein